MEAEHTFELTVDAVPGAIERVLSVVRRRGLGVSSFCADAAGDGRWSVRIRAGAVPAEAALALKQFSTLVDVLAARLRDDASETN
jgi:acetolactate synthase regulatory subunit